MAEDNSSRETFAQLVERLEHLEKVLQANTARLHAVEQQLRAVGSPTPTSPPLQQARQRRPLYETIKDERDESDAPAGTRGPDAGEIPFSNAAQASEPETRSEPPPVSPPFISPAPAASSGAGALLSEVRRTVAGDGGAAEDSKSSGTAGLGETATRRDLESVIGGSWFAWAGIIAITFGVAFILKLAFESGWIGPPVRVLLGVVGGGALLLAGEYLRRRDFRQYAYILSGGGILILYLSVYAAYSFYALIGQITAFVLMAGVTATAVLLSGRHDALPVAVLGLVGGFLTPLLLSTGRDNQVALFTYIALLDAGVLAVAYFKSWRSLNYLSFLATLLMTVGWMGEHYAKEKLWTTVFFLSLFFVLYSLLAVVHNLLPRRPARWFDITLLIANASFYFGTSYLLLEDAGYTHTLPASHALLVSAFYAGLFYGAWKLNRADRLLAYSSIGAAVTFFTIALAIQLDSTGDYRVGHRGTDADGVGLRTGERAPAMPPRRFRRGRGALVHMGHAGVRLSEGAAFVPSSRRLKVNKQSKTTTSKSSLFSNISGGCSRGPALPPRARRRGQ